MRGIRGALATAACAAALATACAPAVALAGDYTYTVRFYAGAQGTLGGQAMVEYAGLAKGDEVTFNPASVELADGSRYYVRGIREAGHDNAEVGQTSFVVTEDADYVVAYGIRGRQVAYTVRYVSDSGAELLPAQEFHGNVGDRPVVAYQWVDGYAPDYRNLTKTLVEDEGENVFTFTYSRISENGGGTTTTVVDLGTTTTVVGGGGAAGGAAAGAAGGAAGGAAATPVATVTTPTAAPTEVIGDDANPLAGGTGGGAQVQTEDIGDLDNPLAAPDGGAEAEAEAGGGLPVRGIVLGALLGAILVVVVAALRRRSGSEE